jgi:ribosomal protein S27AE
MIGKGSKLYSILLLKCPRCHEGPFLHKHIEIQD